MPEKCRTVFLMSRMDEMSNGEIASRLGVSVKAVEKHITKALRILRQKLEDLK
jgi:RNA polymerase sigma-70 factor (ECF subfamily)